MGRENTSTRDWGTLKLLDPQGMRDASVQERGRRRCSSRTPSCNGMDRTKVCQESHRSKPALRQENAMSNRVLFSGIAGTLRNGLCRTHE